MRAAGGWSACPIVQFFRLYTAHPDGKGEITVLHEDVNRGPAKEISPAAERMQDLEIRGEQLEVVAVPAD